MNELEKQLEAIISKFNGTIALAFEDNKTKQRFFVNEKNMMHAASTMKTPVMIEVYKQAGQGKFYLGDEIDIKNEFRSIVDGSLYSMSISEDIDDTVYKMCDKKMSIYDLVWHMITTSNNFATNILIELVGTDNVMKTMKELGCFNIKVLRGVEDNKAFDAGLNNVTDAYDMFLVMKNIAEKKIVSETACDEMIKILFNQKFDECIPKYLPDNIKVAHKTGSITGINHDAAIVYPSENHYYILVILTKSSGDPDVARNCIAEISKVIYESVL